MLLLMWSSNNYVDDNYALKDILRYNGVPHYITRRVKCYKESNNGVIESLVPSCIPSVVCWRHSKCNKILETQNITGKNPKVYLIKLEILEGEEVLVKDGKLYVHRKELPTVNVDNLKELYTFRYLKDKHIIVKSGKIYVEYNKLEESKQKPTHGPDTRSLYCDQSKLHVLEAFSIERDPESLTSTTNKQTVTSSLTRISTTNQVLDPGDITHSVKHASTNTSDMCKGNNKIGNGEDPQCNLANITQNNCKVIFRKMEDNVHFMEQLGLRPIWKIGHQPACKNGKSVNRKYRRAIKNFQYSKVMLKKQKHLNNRKQTFRDCKVVLERLDIVGHRKLLVNGAAFT